jgi:uncharacterized protein (UPF0147 family)
MLLGPLLDRVQANELTAISKRTEALMLVLPAMSAILEDISTDSATDSKTATSILEVTCT